MKLPALFLQAVTILIGIAAIALLLWEPQIEGRNAHATQFQIYFHDPFLAFAYIASLPFFAALWQAFTVLGHVRQNMVFSQASIKALRTIKFCAASIVGFVALGETFILLSPSDDRAGGVFIGLLIAFGASVMAAAATIFERVLQSAINRESGA